MAGTQPWSVLPMMHVSSSSSWFWSFLWLVIVPTNCSSALNSRPCFFSPALCSLTAPPFLGLLDCPLGECFGLFNCKRSTSPRSLLLSPTCYPDSDPCVSLCYLPVVLKRPFWLEFWPWLSTLKVLTQLKLAPGRGAVEPDANIYAFATRACLPSLPAHPGLA